MDKIYKKYKKSGAYHRKLTKTREQYEKTLKNLYTEARLEACKRIILPESTSSSMLQNVELRKKIKICVHIKILSKY